MLDEKLYSKQSLSQRKKIWKGGQTFDSHDFVEIRVKFIG